MNPITSKKLTYKEAYDKIIDAYFKDEISPYSNSFCFCGNLNDRDSNWGTDRDTKNYYSIHQYANMEQALFDGMEEIFPTVHISGGIEKSMADPRWEECLFNGMAKALEVLREIHIYRGETIDSTPTFTKRELTY